MKSLSASELEQVMGGGFEVLTSRMFPPLVNVTPTSTEQLRTRLENALDTAELLKLQKYDAVMKAAQEYGQAVAAEIRARDELVAKFPESSL